MYSFSFTLNQTGVSATSVTGLTYAETDGGWVYSVGLSETTTNALRFTTTSEQVHDCMRQEEASQFLAIVYLQSVNTCLAYNDPFGYQDIFITKDGTDVLITSAVAPTSDPQYDQSSVIEFLSCQAVLPPRTIYQDIEQVPLAQCAVVDVEAGGWTYHTYWKLAEYLAEQATSYDAVVESLRTAFVDSITTTVSQRPGVALSGGIDSGCILGVLHEHSEQPVPSVSFGPYGPDSNDLESARITATHFSSPNTELYPSKQLFAGMLSVSRTLSQPMSGENLSTNIQLLQAAEAAGSDQVFFGYGTEMLLGTMGLHEFAVKLERIERWIPRVVRRPLYAALIRLRGWQGGRRNLLLADTWAERFWYKLAPLFTREEGIYRGDTAAVAARSIATLRNLQADVAHLALPDQLTYWYYSTWMNYGQGRVTAALGRALGVAVALPYNSPAVARVLASTTTDVRRRGNWDKQLWRDAVAPYIPPHLRTRKGKSLTIPYNDILLPHQDSIITYLEGNELVASVVDLPRYRTLLPDLPEPGLHLMRLFSLAIWHDMRVGKSPAAAQAVINELQLA